ncbi:ywdH [Symbiodinium natans]|uniref:YwdH protein n=1 Tax=Symbiodinium natans TaxID=878477 RepID=A0A812GJX8_9DINO|nr:ywdH [Symbiodinium natans]
MILGGIAFYKGLLPEWVKPEPLDDLVPGPLKAGVEADWAIYNEPKGVCINIAPWNAPATLSLAPALSMLAAGNHVVIKPPELVPTVSTVLRKLCQKHLSGYVWVEEGGKEAVERLIAEGADHLAFTGGGEIAKLVAARCGQMLTPVTLELGGKSPAFVDQGLDEDMLRSVVQEILETKVFKTGQFCCAHDYVLIHESVVRDFCRVLKAMVEDLGTRRNVRMLGRRQYNDMTRLFQVFQQEIFGPLLPILPVRDVQEAIRTINQVSAKPLIAYCYTKEKSAEVEFISNVPAGNIAVNGGPMRMISNYAANFGGTGPSGMGASFWGRDGLKEFSNRKHVMSGRNGFARQMGHVTDLHAFPRAP